MIPLPTSSISSTVAVLALAALSVAQTPCFDTSPNDDFRDDVLSSANFETAVRYVNGSSPLTVQYVEMFSGESTGNCRVGLRAHDNQADRPGARLGEGSFPLVETNSWQGAILDAPVTIGAGEVFWITKYADQNHQTPAEPGTGTDVYWSWRDGEADWTGPYTDFTWKFRLFCQVPGLVRHYGSGCGGSTGRGLAGTFFERFGSGSNPFDLGTSLRLTPNGNGWSVAVGQDGFDPNYSGALNLEDDELAYGRALGFDFPLHGGGTTNAIDIDSNGSICLVSAPSNSSDYRFRAEPFGLGVPRILGYDMDLNPEVAGQVYFHTAPGRAVISWIDVMDYDETGTQTFQIQLFDNGEVVIAFGRRSRPDGAVGYSRGGVPGLVANDITDPQNPPMQLDVSGVPVIGNSLAVRASDVPLPASVCGVGVGFVRYEPGIDLSGIGMPHCRMLTRMDVLLPVGIVAGAGQTRLTVPNVASLVRLHVYLQGYAVAPGVNGPGVVLSNAAMLTIGE